MEEMGSGEAEMELSMHAMTRTRLRRKDEFVMQRKLRNGMMDC
jgi:hypothetical protein